MRNRTRATTASDLPRRRVMAEPIAVSVVRAALRNSPRPLTLFSIGTFGSARSAIGSMCVISGSPRRWSARGGAWRRSSE